MDSKLVFNNLYRSHILYRKIDCKSVIRYNIIEKIDFSEYSAMHVDYFYDNEMEDKLYLYLLKLTIERLIDVDLDEIHWEKSLVDAVEFHDKTFGI